MFVVYGGYIYTLLNSARARVCERAQGESGQACACACRPHRSKRYFIASVRLLSYRVEVYLFPRHTDALCRALQKFTSILKLLSAFPSTPYGVKAHKKVFLRKKGDRRAIMPICPVYGTPCQSPIYGTNCPIILTNAITRRMTRMMPKAVTMKITRGLPSM